MSNETVTKRITAYLASGGLFNPELANHDAVRDLLIDARAEIDHMRAEWINPADLMLDRETILTLYCKED